MTPRVCLALLGALAVAVVLPATPAAADLGDELPANVFAAAPGDEILDVLFFADTRPLFVRFHIRVDGDGFRTVWSDFTGRLHRYLDSDGDGVVTLKEAQQRQLRTAVLPVSLAAPSRGAGPSAAALDSDPKDGTISIAELATYLRSTLSFGEFAIQPGPAPDPKAQALFAHLDLDHDGALAAAELAASATDACLARLDLNEDELISLAEMRLHE